VTKLVFEFSPIEYTADTKVSRLTGILLDSLSDIMSQLTMKVLGFEAGAAFSEFNRLILQDGSSFALHKALAAIFPGRFNAVSPAAVELHCTMDLLQDAPLFQPTTLPVLDQAHRFVSSYATYWTRGIHGS
jgi:hypothetical protein